MSRSHPPKPLANAPNGHGETVLVIEDQDSMRMLLIKVLETFNYRVIQASNVPEALQQWKAHASTISAVVSDCNLGSDRDGLSLAREFSEEKPTVVTVVASGTLSPKLIDELHRTTRIRCLQKPYPLADLLDLLHEGLHGQPPTP